MNRGYYNDYECGGPAYAAAYINEVTGGGGYYEQPVQQPVQIQQPAPVKHYTVINKTIIINNNTTIINNNYKSEPTQKLHNAFKFYY